MTITPHPTYTAQFDLYDSLSAPFSADAERTVSKSGTKLTYLPISEVITRVNRVVGIENWSSEIINVGRDPLDPDWVVAHVRVTMVIDGKTATRDGVGGEKVKRTRNNNEILDLGDTFKGAVSDATKKAIQALGVGMYLARTEEAMAADYAEDMAAAPVAHLSVVDDGKGHLWDRIVEFGRTLDDAGKNALKAYYTKISGNPKMGRDVMSVDDMKAVIAEATRLSFGGSYDND